MNNHTLDITTLETWLWEAACKIRGPVDAPKYKDYILPLVFLKRLSDVFDDEVARLGDEFGSQATAGRLIEDDHSLVRFYVPRPARWDQLARLTTGLGEALTDAVRAVSRENPKLAGVIDVVDFNATQAGQRIVGDDRLRELVQVLGQHRLGLRDVEPDILGRAYEYLLRKFAEGSGQSAGEFYTPRQVGVLMAHLLDPQPGMTAYDPTCGSGGLLIKLHLRLLETHGVQQNGRRVLPPQVAPLRVFGQEILPSTFAMARMNAFIHDMEAEIALGDTMRRPAFTNDDGSLRRFDLVSANPMWNQDVPTDVYANDPYGRFERGAPPASSADWGWVQHMAASLAPGGRMAVVLDTGAVSRGSGNQGSNRERDIRRRFVEDDLIEAVILLPENLFYNTTAPGIIMVLRKGAPGGGPRPHAGEILLINASRLFVKGRPKNELTDEHVAGIAALYHEWRMEEGLAAVITTAEAARNDYNLSPSRYVTTDGGEEVLPLEEAMTLLREAEEERAEADAALREVLHGLGLV
ncbi:MAG TPA: class I SAM-dependent DNA methyltransferase [Anaerolineae bacterium]|nr:class I SAM-dependent DNA methyltransferase [Anaerolineae bacterium]